MNSKDFGYIPDEDHGYIPDEFVPEDVAEFDVMVGKYNQAGQPAIVSWDAFETTVQKQADTMDQIRAAGWQVLWWEIAGSTDSRFGSRIRDNSEAAQGGLQQTGTWPLYFIK